MENSHQHIEKCICLQKSLICLLCKTRVRHFEFLLEVHMDLHCMTKKLDSMHLQSISVPSQMVSILAHIESHKSRPIE